MNLSTFEAFKSARKADMIVPNDDQLVAIQAILLHMLLDVKEYCDTHDLTYLLSGGSVLGAIRHGGFIPWDDDVDLFMPRPDYERFIEGFAEHFGDKYWIDSPEHTPEVGIPIARIRLEGTHAVLYNDIPTEHDGVSIDIFVLESVPNNPVLRYLHGIHCMTVGFAFSCSRIARDKQKYLELADDNERLKRIIGIKAAIGRMVSFKTTDSWCNTVKSVYSAYSDEDSCYISCPSGRLHYFGEMYKRSDFLPPHDVLFEGIGFKAPHIPERYLEILYGDWHSLPPVEKRERHGYLALELGDYESIAGKEVKLIASHRKENTT